MNANNHNKLIPTLGFWFAVVASVVNIFYLGVLIYNFSTFGMTFPPPEPTPTLAAIASILGAQLLRNVIADLCVALRPRPVCADIHGLHVDVGALGGEISGARVGGGYGRGRELKNRNDAQDKQGCQHEKGWREFRHRCPI
jgi:hypothetical protein